MRKGLTIDYLNYKQFVIFYDCSKILLYLCIVITAVVLVAEKREGRAIHRCILLGGLRHTASLATQVGALAL